MRTALVGLHGMGGIGKTTLAVALARDPAVKDAFPDGIVWINLGQIDPRTRREDLTARQADLAFALSGKEAFFRDVEAGKTRLSAVLADKRVLLILDDAWDLTDLQAFDVAPESGCLVVTSRNGQLLSEFGAAVHVVGVLGKEAGLELLARASGTPGDQLPAEARDVLRECGYLPLAIALCAGQARAGVPWTHIPEALREADLEFLDASNSSVMKALKSSVDALPEPRLREAYLRLAVYPADVAVPVASLGTHLQDAGGIALSADGRIGYSISRKDDGITAWDVDSGAVRWKAYGRGAGLPIIHVSRSGEYLVTTSRSVSVKSIKVWETTTGTLLIESEAELARLLLSRDGTRLAGVTHASEIKVWTFPDCQLFRTIDLKPDALPGDVAAQDRAENAARPCSASVIAANLDTPGQLLLVGLDLYLPDPNSESGQLYECAVSVSSLITGASRQIARHPGGILRTAISRQGRHAAAAFHWLFAGLPSDTPNIYVWDVGSGQLIHTLLHPATSAVVFAPDGRHLCSAGSGGEIKIWRVSDGEEVGTLGGHFNRVSALAFTEDGEHLVSISYDCSVAVWRVDSSKQIATFTSDAQLEHLAVSSGGDTVVVAQSDGRVHILRLSGLR